MPKYQWLLIPVLLWFTGSGLAVEQLQLPQPEWQCRQAVDATPLPWRFNTQGIWERTSGRYLGPLPFKDLQSVRQLLWSEPWLLALDAQGQVHQAQRQGAHFQQLRQFSYGHPKAEDTADSLVYSAPWLASLSELPEKQQVFWIRDLRTGELAAEFSLPEADAGNRITAWDFDGEYLALGRNNPLQPMLEVWHWPSQKQVRVLDGPHMQIQALQLQGKTLATVTDQNLCSWHWPAEQAKGSCQAFKYPEPRVLKAEKGTVALFFAASQHLQQALLRAAGQLTLTPPETVEGCCFPEPQKQDRTSHWLQLASQQVLQHVPGESLRIWRFGEYQPKTLNPCQYVPSDWSDCWSVLLHWSEDRAFVLLYKDMPHLYNLVGSGGSPSSNHPRLALVLNLQTGHAEQLLPLAFGFYGDTCLTASHWILKGSPDYSFNQDKLWAIAIHKKGLASRGLDPRHQDFELACMQAQTAVHQTDPLAAWQVETSVEWYQQMYPAQSHPVAMNGPFLFNLHPYGYLMRRHLQQAQQTTLYMPPEKLKDAFCFQHQTWWYCLNPQQQWFALDLQDKQLALRSLLDTPWAAHQTGLKLNPEDRQAQDAVLQRHQRQVLLYPSPGGPVWVTDQGHFFRQGEIPLAEMPYLVQGLKSVDLPSRLESWTEVARALKGLPPLRQSGLKLQFGELKNEN